MNSEELSNVVVKGMEERKAEDIVVMDLRKVKGSICDFFVICSGNSDTQIEAIAKSIESEVEVIERVLRNKITGTYVDGVILNAAVMLYLGGMASTIQAGLPVAREALCSGVAYAALLKVRAMTSSVVSQLG